MVQVTFDAERISYGDILDVFFAIHDPTTRDRQGNDTGPQYRSVIFVHDGEQQETALRSKAEQQTRNNGRVVTVVEPAQTFYPAEDYHQQYLEKNPGGYCGLGGTGVSCPIGVARAT